MQNCLQLTGQHKIFKGKFIILFPINFTFFVLFKDKFKLNYFNVEGMAFYWGHRQLIVDNVL